MLYAGKMGGSRVYLILMSKPASNELCNLYKMLQIQITGYIIKFDIV